MYCKNGNNILKWICRLAQRQEGGSIVKDFIRLLKLIILYYIIKEISE